MFVFIRSVSNIVALLAAAALGGEVSAAMTDDLFTGTLAVEQGQAIFTRCDAAENRYVLIDYRTDKERALTGYAAPVGEVFDIIGTADDAGSVTTLMVREITARKSRPVCHLIDIDAMFAPAEAQPIDPLEKFDLAALLECRSDADSAARFRKWLALDPKTLGSAGLNRVTGQNFMAEYLTEALVQILGHPTETLALHPDGFLAVFDDIAPQELARDLGAKPMLSTDPFIAQKVIETSAGPSPSANPNAVRVLTVMSREGLPGKAVAGCLYFSVQNGQR